MTDDPNLQQHGHLMALQVAMLYVLAALCTPAWAINKCTAPDGKVTYQEAVCEGGKKVDISGAGQAATSSPGASYWRGEIARQKHEEKVEAAIANREIFIGMKAEDARRSWGRPHKINSSVGRYGKHEQWVYDRGNHRSQYVYVEKGVVTSTQSPE